MAQPTTKQSSSAKTSDEQKQKNLSKVSYGADKKVRDQAYNEYVDSTYSFETRHTMNMWSPSPQNTTLQQIWQRHL